MQALIARLRKLFQREPLKVGREDVVRWFLSAPPGERRALLILLTDLNADPGYEQSLRDVL